MIPYGHQWVGKDDISRVIRVLKSDWLTQGKNVLNFEKKLAQYCTAKYAVAASSGTSALHMAYLAAGLGEGDEVITTPNTFVATTNMLLAVGAIPVFCDIRLDTYNIDETKIESLITKKTKAIVPVDFAGHPCNLRAIKKIAKKYNLLVIEDACQALGARYKSKKIGSLSDMSIFSFHPVKSITTGEGGAIVTDSKKYYEKLMSLRSHGIHKDRQGKNVMTLLGYNYRLTDFQSALGMSQLKKLNRFIILRHRVSAWYAKELGNAKEIILPVELKDTYSAWHIYVIRVARAGIRDKFMAHMKSKGIGVNFHFPSVYKHPYYKKLGYKQNRCPAADVYHASAITLPLHPQLREQDVKYISKCIKEYFRVK